MHTVDFNSDMGEGFGPWTIGDGVDNELMGFISSANVATGFHAGDPSTMRRTVEQAKCLGVAIGAPVLTALTGKLPTVEEYMAYAADIDSMAADVYRYLSFDQIAEFVEAAETVTL